MKIICKHTSVLYNFKYQYHVDDELIYNRICDEDYGLGLKFCDVVASNGYRIYSSIPEIFYNMVVTRDKKIAILNMNHRNYVITQLCKWLVYTKFEYTLEIV